MDAFHDSIIAWCENKVNGFGQKLSGRRGWYAHRNSTGKTCINTPEKPVGKALIFRVSVNKKCSKNIDIP